VTESKPINLDINLGKSYNTLNKIVAAVLLLVSFIIYVSTMAPTTSFWDCGEFIATSFIMGVPHPPGSPLFLILGNIFTQLPLSADIGVRMNFISPIASALAVMLVYLITVLFIEEWRGPVNRLSDAIIAYGSAFVSAFTFALTDSHWFNSVETEVYAVSTFTTAIVVWLILKWSRDEGKAGNVRYILLIAYIFGLAIGIHLLNLLALPFIGLIIYYKKFKFKWSTFLGLIVITGAVFLIIYQGIIKGVPTLAAGYGIAAPIFIVLAVVAATVWAILQNRHLLSTVLTSLLLIFVGYSTYTVIFVRATQHPAINENNPDTIDGAVLYMNRDQYGDWSILDRTATLKRPECTYASRYTKNKNNPTTGEAWNFFLNYQVKEMYLRYFAWQFIGRGGFDWDVVNLQGKLLKKLEGIDVFRYGLPFAFLFGIAGLLHHFYKDWKRALAILALFLVTGLMIIIYLNQYDPQPRERDYSYVGSFMAFSFWIGIGIAGLLERVKEYFKNTRTFNTVSVGIVLLLIVFMPIKMLAVDYHEHDRSGNFVAWDYAYNMLNSCEPDGIIFTNCDNDTFPLWYLQEVEGIRKDVRVVNLSLLNTSWYVFQLRDDPPTIPLTLSDEEIRRIMPIPWEEKAVTLQGPTPDSPPFTWTLKPTYAGQYLRVQDLMIYRILKDVKWKRPVYFAVTVSPQNQIGLDDYLQMEGLVYRVHPEKVPDLNYDRMAKLIEETDDMDDIIVTGDDWLKRMQTDDGIFRYRNLNNPEIYFNANIQRLIQNYRSGFLRLALENVYTGKPENNEKTYGILKKMDQYFPPDLLPYNNPDLELQIARLYHQAGYDDDAVKLLDKIQQESAISLETRYYLGQMYLTDLQRPDSAVTVFKKLYADPAYAQYYEIVFALVQAYSQSGQRDEAIKVLETWILDHPDDKNARSSLKLLQGDPS